VIPPRWRLVSLSLVATCAFATYASAQFGRGFGGLLGGPPQLAPRRMPDRNFAVCRIMYQQVRSEPSGAGWQTDYPYGEMNLTIRFSELTKTRVSRGTDGRPNNWVVRLTDDSLFNCPYTVASDVGTIGLSDEEAQQLRTYLLKGGFLWVDDFWGDAAWEHWTREIAKALPPTEFPIEDVPLTDPIFSSQFTVKRIPQVPRYPFWAATGRRETSERGEETRVPHFRAIRDDAGRIIVAMTHNTDIADSWEREGEEPGYFYAFSPDGYALGINVLLYAMTH
jgi:hypothetical protein